MASCSSAGLRGRYLIHCHNLDHEDRAMMAAFITL
ncbi:MAG: multicopper oxidase domain-containing protein [Pseudonocardiaceae bacterium]